MDVPFFRYPHVFEHHREVLERALIRVSSAGAFILQQDLRDFEEELASYCGVAAAVGVGNATDGLEMLVEAAGIGPGDEVILPSHTFVATASAVVRSGAVPVFAEIGEDHVMDPADAAARVTPRTRAVMPTQLNGRVADMDRVGDMARANDLVVIEDSAQGLGARFGGAMAGSFGFGGVFSFYPAKALGCFGDGGAIITNDLQLAEVLRETRDHGRKVGSSEVVRWGRNSRLDNLQAALLLEKLALFDEEIATRRALAARYHQNLYDVSQLVLPPPPQEEGGHFDTFQNYEIEVEDRDALRKHLREKDVGTILQWGGKGVHQFEALGFSTVSLPRTELMFERSLLLPMNTSLSMEEVDYVSGVTRAFYGA